MKELLRTTDPTLMALAQMLLRGEDIAWFEFDVNTSIIEGSIGIFAAPFDGGRCRSLRRHRRDARQ
jgi:hypothetical protein